MLKKSNFKKSRNQLEGYSPDLQNDKPYIPQELCTICPECKTMLFQSDLDENNGVCPKCGHHFRLSARQRLAFICDEDSYEPWDEALTPKDPIAFPGYGAKLRASRLRSRELEGALTGKALVGGSPCAVFAMDPGFMMGSMGSVIGEKITRLFERATQERLPVIGFTVSGGARMQEGILSLMQMAKTSGAVKLHSDQGLLYIPILTDPTTGGVTASFAMEGDIILSEPGALIGFAGPRVIEQTMRQKLPKGFQTAEFLLEKGFVDAVVPRTELKTVISRLLRLHCEEA